MLGWGVEAGASLHRGDLDQLPLEMAERWAERLAESSRCHSVPKLGWLLACKGFHWGGGLFLVGTHSFTSRRLLLMSIADV